ncbi:MAG TPA: CDP-alcohol phosphatidyltransferase family protein [Kribbella sp.]|uniref:phosphatidylinositol phosphate synthase n=1 Tax=Kribbella sp. TaxID=1871183 RepID=UPI002D797CA7|nr:CDP-alcohol phosphatidyltransferase family protein [Kribbella sp.]HET6299489.1 CDP-alcohol phosphatidyltransferase family protein [Kribbella sp.]
MLSRFRQFWTKVITPIANLLLKLGVSADAVTLVGTLGVSAGALIFFPRGQIWLGVVVITVFVFSDLIDGYMARTSGTSSKWGSYLDSTLDRLGDGAIFGGLALYYAGSAGDSRWMAAVTLWALVMGATTSYARAKAESLGLHASGGLAERSDRLVSVLVIGFFSDVLNLPILLKIVLCALAVASTITVIQRTLSVRKQVLADPANAGLPTPPPGPTTTDGPAATTGPIAAGGSAATTQPTAGGSGASSSAQPPADGGVDRPLGTDAGPDGPAASS